MINAKRSVAFAILLLCPVLGAFPQNSGPSTYKARCSMCHGADGAGNTPAGKATKTPSFNSPEMLRMPDADFVADTKNGKGRMPAYSGKLSDREIGDVSAYIRTLQKK